MGDEAQTYCQNTKRGQLATIHDNDQNRRVAEKCLAMGEKWHCWIGLKRPFTQWIDGSAIPFTAWSPGEPNNAGNNEDCTEIYSEKKKWNDLKCSTHRAFICETWRVNAGRYRHKYRGNGGGKCCKSQRRRTRRYRRDRRRWQRIRRWERWKKRQKEIKREDLREARRTERRRRERWREHLRHL